MKLAFKTLAAVVALALPATSQAQIDNSVAVNLLSQPYATGGTNYASSGQGGGFRGNFAIDFPLPTGTLAFNNYLLWCIDPNRTVATPPSGPYTYAAYTALDFANSPTLGAVNNYSPTVGDMQSIVWLVNDLYSNWGTYNPTQKQDRQGSIWALFRVETTPINMANIGQANLNDWVVLYNGRNQTFITYVSEPNGALLVFAALGGLGMVTMMRRRRA